MLIKFVKAKIIIGKKQGVDSYLEVEDIYPSGMSDSLIQHNIFDKYSDETADDDSFDFLSFESKQMDVERAMEIRSKHEL